MDNPYNQNLIIFFERLNFIFGSYNILCTQLRNYEYLSKENLKNNNFSPEIMRAGSCLLMQDVTEKPKSLCPYKYTTGKFEIKGEEYFKHLKEVKIREASWCVSQSFEAFERFLSKIIFLTHELKPDCIKESKIKKFEEKCPVQPKSKNNYMLNYINYSYRSNKNKLKFLKEFSTNFKRYSDENYSLLNFEDWFKFLSEARHAIVHNEMIIKYNKFNWSDINKRFMDKYFPGSLSENGYLLLFEGKNVRINLETLLEFGFLIYKSLSAELNYDLYYFK